MNTTVIVAVASQPASSTVGASTATAAIAPASPASPATRRWTFVPGASNGAATTVESVACISDARQSRTWGAKEEEQHGDGERGDAAVGRDAGERRADGLDDAQAEARRQGDAERPQPSDDRGRDPRDDQERQRARVEAH